MKKLFLFIFTLSSFTLTSVYAQVYSQHAVPVSESHYWTSITGICALCAIANPEQAANSDLSDYTSILVPAGVAGTVSLRLKMNSTVLSGNYAGLKVNRSVGLIDLSVLETVALKTYMNGTLQESRSGSSQLLLANLGAGSDQSVHFLSSQDFNEIEISVSGLAVVLNNMNVYYGYGDAGISLPIEIRSFHIEQSKKQNAMNIQWTAASEDNNSRFEVQRSSDGNYFEVIKLMLSKENFSDNLYTVVDYQPLTGISYYRLKQTDDHDNHSYSQIIAVENRIEADRINIYSSAKGLTIENRTGEEGFYKIEIMNMSGTSLMATEIFLSVGMETILDGITGESGLFLVRIACSMSLS